MTGSPSGATPPHAAGARVLGAVTAVLVGALGVVVGTVARPGRAEAGAWVVGLAAGSRGQATATALPAAPTGVTAGCAPVSLAVVVSWNAVPHASGYSVWQSTTAAGGPYTLAATGIAATTWTSPILQVGTYWYEVRATVGSSWTSALSSATAGRTILLAVCA